MISPPAGLLGGLVAVLVAARPGVAAAQSSAEGAPAAEPIASDPRGADDELSEPAEPPETVEGLVTNTWDRPELPPFEPVWNLLRLPERLIEALFLPISGLVSVVESQRLDKRVVDLLTNDEGTFRVTPKVNFGLPDGLGLGGTFTFKKLRGDDTRLDVSGRYRINGDFDVGARFRDTFARLEGRLLELQAEYEVDSNEPYYGIGGDSQDEDRRVLRKEELIANGAIDLDAAGSLLLSGKILFGFSRRRLEAGTDPGQIPVGAAGDTVEPPPGFDETINYPRLGIEVRLDTRDRQGRPTRGTLARFRGALTSDVGAESDLNAAQAVVTVNQFIEIFPLFRTLVLTAGAGVATPLEGDATVPYHELITLGRDNFLRGYRRDRFKGRYGWWASAQYQFPVGEYMDSNVALNAALFFDTGQIGNELGNLVDWPIRYSYGIGLGIAHTSKSVVSVSLGLSPEGSQFVLAGGMEL